jgi:hypothetical protein
VAPSRGAVDFLPLVDKSRADCANGLGEGVWPSHQKAESPATTAAGVCS